MSEQLKNTLKYLKNKNNTRRIKTITINEAHEVVEEIERLNNKVEELMELYTSERHVKEYYKNGNRTLRIKYEGIKKLLEKKDKEIERLENIIKEVREYVDKWENVGRYKLLEILDKENKE